MSEDRHNDFYRRAASKAIQRMAGEPVNVFETTERFPDHMDQVTRDGYPITDCDIVWIPQRVGDPIPVSVRESGPGVVLSEGFRFMSNAVANSLEQRYEGIPWRNDQ